MNTDSLLIRGIHHNTYSEDALLNSDVSDDWLILAVFDGCSSGLESHFASTFYSKLVSKACKTLPFLEKINPNIKIQDFNPNSIGEFILNQVFEDTKKLRKELLLELEEMLSTILLLVINKKKKNSWLAISGDGFYCINNTIKEIYQNNTPNYLGYHLNLSFDKWFQQHCFSIGFENVTDICIATDGVAKLAREKDDLEGNDLDTVEFLMQQNSLSLNDRYKKLQNEYHLVPKDDIALVCAGL